MKDFNNKKIICSVLLKCGLFSKDIQVILLKGLLSKPLKGKKFNSTTEKYFQFIFRLLS